MGCVYTGSAGGAIATDTTNCANEVAGMAIVRRASINKRMVRILNHLARSSFDCPVVLAGCGLCGLKRATRHIHKQGLQECIAESEHYGSVIAIIAIGLQYPLQAAACRLVCYRSCGWYVQNSLTDFSHAPKGRPSLPGLRAFRIDRVRQRAGMYIWTKCQSAGCGRFDVDSWISPTAT